MEMDATFQIIVAVALGVLTIVWNQQRSVGNLRQEFQEANAQMRQEFQEANAQMRRESQEANAQMRRESQEANAQMRQQFQEANAQMRREFQEAIEQLRGAVAGNGERLARIEGHLGIGVAPPRAPRTGETQVHPDEAAETRHAATG